MNPRVSSPWFTFLREWGKAVGVVVVKDILGPLSVWKEGEA